MKKKFISLVVEDPTLVPSYASEKAAGADLRANISEPVVLEPGESKLLPTGLIMEIPDGFEVQIRPRSGMALKHQITVLNTPGTIDADYRGEVKVILINHGKTAFTIEPKMRIAQAVLAPVYQAEFVLKDELVETTRGAKGFGHTGTH